MSVTDAWTAGGETVGGEMVARLDRVSYRYSPQGPAVLKELSLEVEAGELLVVTGPSGSGKSTFLRLFNGLVPNFHGGVLGGRLEVCGLDPVAQGPSGMASEVGFVTQDPESQTVAVRVEDEIAFALENAALSSAVMRKRVEEGLDQLSIADLRQRPLEELSGGERQRVALAAALVLQPSLLVLDEPTSQLDPQGAEEVLSALRRLNEDLGLTIVVAEHRLERIAHAADRLLYLPASAEEEVLLGEPREVLAKAGLGPPLTRLGAALGWRPVPLTVREARPRRREILEVLSLVFPEPAGEPPKTSSPQEQQNPESLVQASNLRFSYPDGDSPFGRRDVLRGVDFTLAAGERIALLGRNGSGKSTLLKLLVGLLEPEAGRLRVLRQQPRRSSLAKLARSVALLPQNPLRLLFRESVEEELRWSCQIHDVPWEKAEALLQRLGLEARRHAHPRDLSSGERQRAALAALLVSEPRVLLLDEPTRGLDPVGKDRLLELLEEQSDGGAAVVLVTHDVELAARFARRVVLLAEGEAVVDGPVREVMTSSTVFATQINKWLRDPRYLTVQDVLEALPPQGDDAADEESS
ncbi:MAG: ATP-binding cassette domain-containing protein [Acidobacteriota bacterium]